MDIYREMEKIEEGGKSADKADIERIHQGWSIPDRFILL